MNFRYGFVCFVHHFVSYNNGLKNYLKAGLQFWKKQVPQQLKEGRELWLSIEATAFPSLKKNSHNL